MRRASGTDLAPVRAYDGLATASPPHTWTRFTTDHVVSGRRGAIRGRLLPAGVAEGTVAAGLARSGRTYSCKALIWTSVLFHSLARLLEMLGATHLRLMRRFSWSGMRYQLSLADDPSLVTLGMTLSRCHGPFLTTKSALSRRLC
jgi:hypothetical protein